MRAWLDAAGMRFETGTDAGHRAHRRPDPRPVPHVHRRPAHRRRVRLRPHRHPVPAGPEGPGARPATWPRGCSTTPTGRRCTNAGGRRRSAPARPLPHFNEVDECAGLDALLTNRVWTALGPAARDHAARHPVGRRRPVGHDRRVRVGVRDQRRGAARPPRRRLRAAPSASASRRCTSASAAAPSRA